MPIYFCKIRESSKQGVCTLPCETGARNRASNMNVMSWLTFNLAQGPALLIDDCDDVGDAMIPFLHTYEILNVGISTLHNMAGDEDKPTPNSRGLDIGGKK